MPLYLLIIVVFPIAIGGCAPTYGDRESFRSMMDHEIGRNDGNYSDPESVSVHGDIIRMVFHKSEGNCFYYIEFDKASRKALRWGYLSAPDNCYLETSYRGPW